MTPTAFKYSRVISFVDLGAEGFLKHSILQDGAKPTDGP